jgi:ferredoxin
MPGTRRGRLSKSVLSKCEGGSTCYVRIREGKVLQWGLLKQHYSLMAYCTLDP